MRIDQLTVQLRARSGWEALELGMALVRRHAAAIYLPWLWMSLLLFCVLNLLCWAIDRIWLAALLMWWLKPVFDRIPLYVLSRAVFGQVPSTRQTLAAQRGWGWRPMLQHLTWRRLSPVRSLYLPVDLLETGSAGKAANVRGRHAVLAGPAYGHAALLTLVCVHFEMVISLGCIALVFLFTPVDYLPETARAMWALMIDQPPWWAQMALNAVAWLATSVVEPFFVGAGFGLYLNRRTQLEAWEVEIVFRRLRQRLASAVTPWLLVLALGAAGWSSLAQAQQADIALTPTIGQSDSHADDRDRQTDADDPADAARPKPAAATLAGIFGEQQVDDGAFRRAAERAYQDPLLGQKRTSSRWELRGKADKQPPGQRSLANQPWLRGFAAIAAFIAEWGLWLLLAALVVLLLATLRYWWPWMRGQRLPGRTSLQPAQQQALPLPESLPDDIAGSALRLWRDGQQRNALALLYRASVDSMSTLAQVVLPPAATEAQCLRASRRIHDPAQRQLFARMVRVWQYAAYARQLPGDDEFHDLLQQLRQGYRWPA
ncbi:hypothetical protein [Pseudoxanthomonas dokdonensis]|uniref:DUF4129 domain-containing protein n=1 Tax=Pseudoxanthomonas dokdonensis TaxID=344882 RepID=A0A0R0CQ19_9GAMM|nr:hypothetical protein [Pseudoxanthomonas dokdonensis]KRG68330.1 hypothetical protein ABB29_13495 [Pseudoxanthomonas dokdonensis]